MAVDFPAAPTVGQVFISGAQSWTWDGTKWVASGVYVGPPQFSNANRIINGDMRIDQRNNGASGTANGYTLDRWNFRQSPTGKGTWQRNGPSAVSSIIVGNGFPYQLLFTSSSAYTPAVNDTFYFNHPIEADLVSDFAWGNANGQAVTLSFWAQSSLTGTFGGTLNNANSPNRAYPFTYSIPSANTWARIVITIPPPPADGAWITSGNGLGVNIFFDLGTGANFRGAAGAWGTGNFCGATGAVNVVGTNGATWYLTGVKLEVGSVATPFNRKSPQESLADCQRYCYRVGSTLIQSLGAGYCASATLAGIIVSFPVTMRANPTVSASSGAGFTVNGAASTNVVAAANGVSGMQVNLTASGLVAASGATANVTANNWIGFDAEL